MHQNTGKQGLFYGWWIVGACSLVSFYTGGIVSLGFTSLLEPIANDRGWSYAQISLAASLRGLEVGLLAPLLGQVVDRWGPRRLMFAGGILTGLGMLLLSRTSTLAMFYGAFVLVAMGMSALSGTVILTAVVNWFRKRMAIAIGIVGSGFAAGGLLVPVMTHLIDTYEWRTAMVILGVGTWLVVLPVSLLVRHKPEQYDCLPDGELRPAPETETRTAVQEGPSARLTTLQAARTRAFWHIGVACICHMFVTSAVMTHVMPYLGSIGIARSAASMAAGALPIASIGGRLGFGWLADRFQGRLAAGVAFAIIALGLVAFGRLGANSTWLLVPFLILFGTGWGGAVTMRGALVREYFGRSMFGAVYGLVMGLAMLGSVAGAPTAGWIFDERGSYGGLWFALALLGLATSAIVLALPRSRRYAKKPGDP